MCSVGDLRLEVGNFGSTPCLYGLEELEKNNCSLIVKF